MISEKFSTNPESFIEFGRGRRIGWRLHMETPVYSGKRKKKGTTCVFQHPYMSRKILLEIILRTTTKRKYLSLIEKRLSLLAIASSFILWFSQWKSKLYTREIIIHN
jgi:hypothetical protein